MAFATRIQRLGALTSRVLYWNSTSIDSSLCNRVVDRLNNRSRRLFSTYSVCAIA